MIDEQLDEVTEDDIIAFFATKLSYSQSSLDKMYQLLGAVYKKAARRKIIEENPIREIKCPKSSQTKIPVRALTVDEQEKLLEVLKSEDIHYSEIMLLSMFTGMRIGECCALMVEDINLTNKTIIVNKTVALGKNRRNLLNETKTSTVTRTLHVNDTVADFLRTIIGEKRAACCFYREIITLSLLIR